MNGRLEKELRAEEKMKNKLRGLPPVFTDFYSTMVADGKSYTTMQNYISHNVDFMNYVTNNAINNTFYFSFSTQAFTKFSSKNDNYISKTDNYFFLQALDSEKFL